MYSLSHEAHGCLTFEELSEVSQVAAPLYILTRNVSEFWFVHTIVNICSYLPFWLYPSYWLWSGISFVMLNGISLITNEIEHLSCIYCPFLCLSWKKKSFRSFAHWPFYFWVVAVIIYSSYNLFSDIGFIIIFYKFMDCAFTSRWCLFRHNGHNLVEANFFLLSLLFLV